MSAASYIRIWLASAIAILGTVAAFNLVIDPYDVSRLLELPRLNAMKPAELGRARLRKPFDLWRRSYDGIALGASQVEQGIDPEHPGLSARGLTLYNVGISEERPFEQALLLHHAAETTRVRFAIVALDFLRYVGGGGKPEFMPSDWTRSRAVIDYLKSLVSASAVRDSIATIRSRHSAARIACSGIRIPYTFPAGRVARSWKRSSDFHRASLPRTKLLARR